jgi:hypothetical protein
MARATLLDSLSKNLRARLPTLYEPTPQELRRALAGIASGDRFAGLDRDFFARLSYRWLDWYLSRELANHTGSRPGRSRSRRRLGPPMTPRRSTGHCPKTFRSTFRERA